MPDTVLALQIIILDSIITKLHYKITSNKY